MAKKKVGFAALPREKLLEICRKGGRAVPKSKRSFSQDPDLARRAGRLGGLATPDSTRSFSANRELARAAGRKGGSATRAKSAH